MKIIKGFDEKLCLKIARETGSDQLYKDVKYTRIVTYRGTKEIICERLDEIAFFIGYENQDHFRLIGIGTIKQQQGKGYGRFMLERVKEYCKKKRIKKIKTRTSAGVDFYQMYGGGKNS